MNKVLFDSIDDDIKNLGTASETGLISFNQNVNAVQRTWSACTKSEIIEVGFSDMRFVIISVNVLISQGVSGSNNYAGTLKKILFLLDTKTGGLANLSQTSLNYTGTDFNATAPNAYNVSGVYINSSTGTLGICLAFLELDQTNRKFKCQCGLSLYYNPNMTLTYQIEVSTNEMLAKSN